MSFRFNEQAYLVLGVSMVAEGGTLVMAIKSIHKGAKERGISFYEYGQLKNDLRLLMNIGIC